MNSEHIQMWSLVDLPGEVLPAIKNAPTWRKDARDYAIVR